MNLTFLGAAREVTGSCYLLEVGGKKVLVECGMFQGGKKLERLNHRTFSFNPADISAVILTHAHIDHSGLLPRLHKEGYKGPIYATPATADLCGVMLPDSAHIQEYDALIANRKGRRGGKDPVEPLYTVEEAFSCVKLFKPIGYLEEFSPVSGMKVRFRDAGHILGSAFAEVWITEEDKTFKIVFSGDLGQPHQPILRDPDLIESADYLLMEGTYGTSVHPIEDKAEKLAEIINTTVKRGGHVIIPAFAVGRAQILLYDLYELMKAKKIDPIPVYLDSPLAVAATQITLKHSREFDDEAKAAFSDFAHKLPNFHFTASVDESKAINDLPGGAVIISASGMADAGRILHHLKYNLWKPECSVVMVGYQAEGSLGRQLINGVKTVRILGDTIAVKAEIHNLEGFSAHADKEEIFSWVGHFSKTVKEIFLIHGEEEKLIPFSKEIQERLGLKVNIPYLGDDYELTPDSSKFIGSNAAEATLMEDDLTDLFREFEDDYRLYREQLMDKAVKDQNAAPEISRRVARVRRFLRKSLDDLASGREI